MPATSKSIRKSVTIPAAVAKKVQAMARHRRISENRVLLDLIETGLDAKEREKQRYLELLEALRACKKPAEQERLMEELAQMTFGD